MDAYEHYVLAIQKHGNLTLAAKAIGVSQPALSAGLNALEKKLDFLIFNRKKSPISLTNEGKIYVAYLLQKQQLEENMEKQIADIRNSDYIPISIGGPKTYMDSYILPVIGSFTKNHPNCNLRLMEGTVSYLSNLCASGNLDLFISTKKELSPEFQLEKIGTEHVSICINKACSAYAQIMEQYKEGKPFPLPALAEENFIFLGNEQPLQLQVNTFLKTNNFVPKSRLEVDQVTSAINLMADNCGVCFATNSALSISTKMDSFTTFPLSDADFPREVYIASLKSTYLTDIHKELISIISSKEAF